MFERLYNSYAQRLRYGINTENVLRFPYWFFAGFGGHVPFGYAEFGGPNQRMTNSALCDFTSNYRHRQSTEWAPVTVSRPDPPMLIHPSEIYHKHVGQIPNYTGHIPGAIFRYVNGFEIEIRINFFLFQIR